VLSRFHLNAEKARRRLHEFVRQAWHVLEPETPFVDGIHVQAICEHLQAVTEGRIRNLIINVPPGHAKSLLSAVFWPAEFEPERRCSTSIGWSDPREQCGELLWPEKVTRADLEELKVPLGSYRYAGQYQQRPAPAEGGIFKRRTGATGYQRTWTCRQYRCACPTAQCGTFRRFLYPQSLTP
jgi:hypothetical protein